MFSGISNPIEGLTSGITDVVSNPIGTVKGATEELTDMAGFDIKTIALFAGGFLLVFFLMKNW